MVVTKKVGVAIERSEKTFYAMGQPAAAHDVILGLRPTGIVEVLAALFRPLGSRL
jgi:hypothetical protein